MTVSVLWYGSAVVDPSL